MRLKPFFIALVFIVTSVFALKAEAMITPVGVSLFPPFTFPPRSSSIVGGRLNFFVGIHDAVYGLDLGAVGNVTDKRVGGVQIAGVFNRNNGYTSITGLQMAGLGNWNIRGSDIIGIQITPGLNTNLGKGNLVGLGIGGLGNRSQGKIEGAQIGIYNQAREVFGLQIGVVNYASSLHGVQIGVINISKGNSLLPICPVLNVGL